MEEKIIEFIQTQLQGGKDKTEIQPEDDLLGSGLVESLGMMKLVGFIEQECQFAIPPQDLTIENFMTVEAMVKYVDQRNS